MDAEIRALIELMPRLRGKEIKARVLDGGLTNRNYHIECEGDEYVLRVMGKNSTLLGIERKFEHTCAQAAHVAGVGPEVVEFLPDPGAMLSRFVAGRALVPTDLHQPAIMQRVVKSLHQYHECASGAGNFSAFETVRRYYARALERQVSIPQNIVQAFEISARIEKEVGLPESVCPCHNDLLSGNLTTGAVFGSSTGSTPEREMHFSIWAIWRPITFSPQNMRLCCCKFISAGRGPPTCADCG